MAVSPAEVESRMRKFLEVCRSSGLKVTHQRLEIFREVASREDHPDAEAIYRKLHSRLPSLSLDTVYRTLRMLGKLNLTIVVLTDQDRVRYDANTKRHHHFVCTKCKSVQDFYADDIGKLRLPEAVNSWGRVTSAHLELRGICAHCGVKIRQKS